MKVKYISSWLVLVVLMMGSCTKYPEGPGISFRTKKSRVANEWAFNSAIESDVDVTEDYKSAVLTLDKSGAANFVYFVIKNGIRTLVEQSGEWSFEERKEHLNIILYASSGSYLMGFEILELKRNNMHLKSDELDKDWHLISNNLR